jgi:hypothetical protein
MLSNPVKRTWTIFLIFGIFHCKAIRENPVNVPKLTKSEYRQSFLLDVICERTVNNVSFDYPISECEDSSDALKVSFHNANNWFLSETGRPNFHFLVRLEEFENHSRILNILNTLSLGIIPYFGTVKLKLNLEIYNRSGEKVAQKSLEENIEIRWHLFYAFHSPFVNPDAVIRETIKDMGTAILPREENSE